MTCKIIIGLMLMSFTVSAQTKWLISESSSLSVNGSTNIDKFSCDIPNCDQSDTLTVRKSEKGIVLTGSINPAVLSFDCHKKMMTRDLQKTLQAKVIHLLGSRNLDFSDFNLVPPRKLGGIIKTKDLLCVEFQLKMKVI